MNPPPLIFTCEHATNHVPRAYKGRIPDQLLASHVGYDLGAAALANQLARFFGAPLLCGEISRLVIDLNRSPHHRGLTSKPLAATPQERRQLIEGYHAPFRQQTLSCIRELLLTGKPVIHISVHSFTRRLAGIIRNTDIGLLYDPRRKGEKRLAQQWQDQLIAHRQRVRRNYPYRGTSDGHTTALRQVLPPRHYVGLELEVCNDRLANDGSVSPIRQVIIESLQLALCE